MSISLNPVMRLSRKIALHLGEDPNLFAQSQQTSAAAAEVFDYNAHPSHCFVDDRHLSGCISLQSIGKAHHSPLSCLRQLHECVCIYHYVQTSLTNYLPRGVSVSLNFFFPEGGGFNLIIFSRVLMLDIVNTRAIFFPRWGIYDY